MWEQTYNGMEKKEVEKSFIIKHASEGIVPLGSFSSLTTCFSLLVNVPMQRKFIIYTVQLVSETLKLRHVDIFLAHNEI